MRRRNSSEERSRKRAGNSREHHRRISTFAEEGIFLAAPAVDVWIALLQSEDHQSLLQCFKAELEELLLCGVCVTREFASNVDWCSSRDEVEDGGRDEFVGEDYGGGLDGAVGGECE